MKHVSKSLEETKTIAEDFVRKLTPWSRALVVALDGDLGSGKTAFSQFVGERLGVKDLIQSPTYLIEKIYELSGQLWQHLIHIDAYRLESEKELLNLGWQDMVKEPKNLILIEWAEKVRPILPEDAIHIVFTHEDETTREIEISTS